MSDLREKLYNHPKAIISTDDNYPTIIQIPVDDLMALFTSQLKEAEIEGRIDTISSIVNTLAFEGIPLTNEQIKSVRNYQEQLQAQQVKPKASLNKRRDR